MDHNDIRHKLSEYLDGSVTPDEQAAIEAHLQTCAECSDAATELRKTIEAMKQVEEVEAPSWMTSKIMAKVREEQAVRRGLGHRILTFFATRYPIQALTVLFMAVTAYYIYTSINPAQKYAGEPVGRVATQEAPPSAPGVLERKEPEMATRREKKAEQAPGYRSLDMKYSYEKPATPVPAEAPVSAPAEVPSAAAPAPAKRAAPMMPKDEAEPEAKAAAPQAAAPAMMAEQAAPGNMVQDRATAGRNALASRRTDEAPPVTREADAQIAVLERFSKTDLPENMKVKGLAFSVRKYGPDLPDLQWMPATASFRTRSCSDRYVVDVELAEKRSKYLYCYDSAKVLLLGIYEMKNDVWSEKK